MILYKQANSEEELKQILALQRQNLPKNLSIPYLVTEGFVTVEHSLELLQKMNDAFPHTLATHEGKVVGYALSMHSKFGNEIAILKSMFDEIKRTGIKERFMVMGQICIAKTHRRKGIFRGLYKHMKQYVQNDFKLIITEVDCRNTRSLQAHKAVGFKELTQYSSDGRVWSLLILK